MSDTENILMKLMPEIDKEEMTYVPCVYCKATPGGCPVCREKGKPGFMPLGIPVRTIHELIQQNKDVWALTQTLQNHLAEIAGLLGEYCEKTQEDLEELLKEDSILPVTLAMELHKEKFPEQYQTENTKQEDQK